MAEKSLRFARNIGFNALGQAVLAAVNFFVVPYLVGRFGLETYGIYIILHAAASYLTLSSFGAGSALIKHVAACRGAHDGRGMRDTLRYAAWVYVLGAGMAGAALWVGAPFVAVRVFHVPGHAVPLAVFVLRCAAAGGLFVGLGQGASAVMQGLQRFDWHNASNVLLNSAMPLGALALAAAGSGLSVVAGWYVALNIAVCILACAVGWRLLLPSLGQPAGKGVTPKAFAFWALTAWSGALAWIVSYQFDKIFIARHLSLSALTLYSVPAGLLQRMQIIPAMVGVVAIPMMSELQGPDAPESLRRMYFKSTRFVLWASLPILTALFALMPQFLSLWLGGNFSDASCWPARLLVLGQAATLLNMGPNTVTFSRDHPWYMPAWAWSQALLSLLAWWILVPRYGLMGVAWGSLAAVALPTAVNVIVVNRRVVGVSSRWFAAEVLYAPFLSAGLMLAVIFPVHGMATGWGRLLAVMAAGIAVFYGVTWALLNDEDRGLAKRFLRWEVRGSAAPRSER
ncbi:MAG: oligosaccharide flippase family protein [Elusimicrobia bacterium]|nr:oligosaccharide flippase family protein [Elusimicrobiota bacterium]